MLDQTRMLGFRPDLVNEATVITSPDPGSIAIELGECAAAVMRREKIGAISLSDDARAALIARVERAQAARGARLARAAGEAVPNAPAPAVGPDTVWSGDYSTLVELFRIGLYRVNTDAAYFAVRPCTPIGFLTAQHARRNGRTHAEP